MHKKWKMCKNVHFFSKKKLKKFLKSVFSKFWRFQPKNQAKQGNRGEKKNKHKQLHAEKSFTCTPSFSTNDARDGPARAKDGVWGMCLPLFSPNDGTWRACALRMCEVAAMELLLPDLASDTADVWYVWENEWVLHEYGCVCVYVVLNASLLKTHWV